MNEGSKESFRLFEFIWLQITKNIKIFIIQGIINRKTVFMLVKMLRMIMIREVTKFRVQNLHMN